MRSTFLKAHDALVETARWAAMTALFTLVALVVAAVVVRYFGIFGGSLHWVDEAARFAMVWIALLGSVVALDRGAHLAVSLLPDALGPRGQRLVLLLANLLSIAFLLVLAVKGWELSQRTMRQVSPSLGLPMGYVYLAIPVGAALMAAQLATYIAVRREREPAAVDASF